MYFTSFYSSKSRQNPFIFYHLQPLDSKNPCNKFWHLDWFIHHKIFFSKSSVYMLPFQSATLDFWLTWTTLTLLTEKKLFYICFANFPICFNVDFNAQTWKEPHIVWCRSLKPGYITHSTEIATVLTKIFCSIEMSSKVLDLWLSFASEHSFPLH